MVFTSNCTTALNTAIKGVITPQDHVITSSLEHNSVSRPLYYAQLNGAKITKIHTDINQGLNAEIIEKALRPDTKLVVCSHISNVTGTVNDIASIGQLCRKKGILFLVDAAQSAGVRDIDVQKMNIDMLAFPGHKGLFAPQGTGGLYIRKGLEVNSLIQGGTGSHSHLLAQPDSFPEKFESGTLNTPGLAGLCSGIRFISETGIENIEKRERELTNRLVDGINAISGINLVSSENACNRGGVVSVVFETLDVTAASMILDSAFDIAVRSGIHCSPDAHQTIGTLESGGTLRISPNFFNTELDIDNCLHALESCVKDFS